MNTSARPLEGARPPQRIAVILRSILVFVVVLAVLAAGLFALHRHRKAAALRTALDQGRAAFEARQYSQAAALLGQCLAAGNQDPEVILKYAEARIRSRPRTRAAQQDAINVLERLLRMVRGHEEACTLLVPWYLQADQPVDAERVARAWSEARPDSPAAGRALAAALLAGKKTARAMELLEQLLRRHPDDIEAAAALAFARLRQALESNDSAGVDQARAMLDETVQRHPASPEARLVRARFLVATGRLPEALPDLEAARASDSAATLLAVGQLWSRLDRHPDAEACFRAAIERSPQEPGIHIAAGQAVLDAADPAAAAALADLALQAPLGEQRIDVLPTAIELLLLTGRPEPAVGLAAEFRKLGGDPAVATYLEGLLAVHTATTAEAVRRGIDGLEKAAALIPGNPHVHLALARARVRLSRLEQGDSRLAALAQAARSYEKHFESSPERLALPHLEAAGVYGALERLEDAARHADEARRLAPTSLRAVLGSIEIQGRLHRAGGPRPNPDRLLALQEEVARLHRVDPENPQVIRLLMLLAGWSGHLEGSESLLSAAATRPVATRPEGMIALSMTLMGLYAEAGDYRKAVEVCKAALPSAPPEARPALAARLGEFHARQGDQAGVRAALELLSAEGRSPAAGSAIVELARFLAGANMIDLAREALVRRVNQDADDMAARLALLEILPRDATDPDRRQILDQIRRIEGPEGRRWRLWQARLMLESQDWAAGRQECERLIRECIESDSSRLEGLALLGRLHEQAGETAQALECYRQAFELSPVDSLVARRLLAVAAQQQNWELVGRVLARAGMPENDARLAPLRAEVALREGRIDQAERLIRQRVEADPRDAVSRLQLVRARMLRDDLPGAQRLLEEVRGLTPDNPDLLLIEAEVSLRAGDRDRAIEACDRLLAADPGHADAYLLRSAARERAGRIDQAEADLRTLAAMPGRQEEGWRALGQMYTRQGRRADALRCWEEGLAAMPDSAEMRRLVAAALLAGDAAQRRRGTLMVDELLKRNPDDEVAMLMKADLLLRTDPAGAEALCRRIVERYPASVGGCRRLASILAARGQLDQARTWVDRGLAAQPRDIDLLLMRKTLLETSSPGLAEVAAGEAVEAARAAVGAQPDNQTAVLRLADVLIRAGQPEAAVEALKGGLARRPDDPAPQVRLSLARLHTERGRLAEAQEAINQAAAGNPSNTQVVVTRLHWHAAGRQWTELARLAGDHLRDHPGDGEVALTAARHLLNSGEPTLAQAALPMFRAATEAMPDSVEPAMELGIACYSLGRYAEAREAFEKVNAIAPGHVGAMNNRAYILAEIEHRPGEAEALIRDLLDKAGADPDYPHLLETWGVIQYRLGVAKKVPAMLEESRRRLKECLDLPGLDPGTRASATFSLARTLVELDPENGRKALQDLVADAGLMEQLQENQRAEARGLLERLGSSGRAGSGT